MGHTIETQMLLLVGTTQPHPYLEESSTKGLYWSRYLSDVQAGE